MNRKEKLEEFADALTYTLCNTDAVKWPIRSKLAISSVDKFYAKEYMEQLSIFIQNYNTSEWHKAFSNSLSLLKVSHHIIDGLEKAKIDKYKITEYILMIIEVSNVLSGGASLIAKNHILLPNVEIEAMYDCFEYLQKKQDLDNLLRLSALLWAYADSIYFQGKEMCCEYHGLYTMENGLKVMIRDYKNFNPAELWPEITFDLKFKYIRIVTFHKNDFSVAIDVYNNIHVLNSSFKESCVGGLLFVDGKRRGEKSVINLINVLLNKLEEQTRYVNRLSKKKLYLQYIYLFWYRKKYLTDYMGLSWKPTKQVFEAFDAMENQEIEVRFENGNEKMIRKKYDYSLYISS